MLDALDQHLGFKYRRILEPILVRNYLGMALTARHNGDRLETGTDVLNCIKHGGWQVPENRRMIVGLAAYVFIGSWYKAFRPAKAAGQN